MNNFLLWWFGGDRVALALAGDQALLVAALLVAGAGTAGFFFMVYIRERLWVYLPLVVLFAGGSSLGVLTFHQTMGSEADALRDALRSPDVQVIDIGSTYLVEAALPSEDETMFGHPIQDGKAALQLHVPKRQAKAVQQALALENLAFSK